MNKVFLNPKGWVEVIWGEQIDTDGYTAAAAEMVRLLKQLGDEGKPRLLLIDFSALSVLTGAAADSATSVTHDLGCDKIAGFAIKHEFKPMLDMIKIRSTKADSIREFQTREEAEKWLEAK